MKKTLGKPGKERTVHELSKISQLVRSNPFFKDKRLTNEEFLDLAIVLTFMQVKGAENVLEYGEKGDEFFIIIQGVVSVKVPNNSIKDHQMKLRDYRNLQRWH